MFVGFDVKKIVRKTIIKLLAVFSKNLVKHTEINKFCHQSDLHTVYILVKFLNSFLVDQSITIVVGLLNAHLHCAI